MLLSITYLYSHIMRRSLTPQCLGRSAQKHVSVGGACGPEDDLILGPVINGINTGFLPEVGQGH